MSVPNISYTRNQANRLMQKLSSEPEAPATKGDLRDIARLVYDLAGFVDLNCQNMHVRVSMSRLRP